MKTFAIIGGGLTGLTAARDLLKAGHAVTIFEGSNELGGLAGGFEFEGTSLEHAYHHVFKTDYDLLELIEELGIADQLNWFESSMGLYYGDTLYEFRTPMDLLKFPPLSFVSKMRLGLTILYLQKTKNWRQFVGVTAAEWMRKHCGEQAFNVIWKPLLNGKFFDKGGDVSMAWLWARIHIRANSTDKGDTTEKLGYMTGGFATMVDALGDDVRKLGGDIRLNSPVQQVDGADTATVMTDAGEEQFDEVIVTTSTHIFSRMLKESYAEYKQQLEQVDYLGAVLVAFSSDQSLNPYYWVSVNDVDSTILAFIEHTKLAPKTWYNDRNVFYLAAYLPHDHKYFTAPDDEVQEEFFQMTRDMFPDFNASQVHNTKVVRLKYAQHIVGTDYEEKKPEYKTPVPHVYLSNFSQIFPEDRGMSYAIRAGHEIAKLVTA